MREGRCLFDGLAMATEGNELAFWAPMDGEGGMDTLGLVAPARTKALTREAGADFTGVGDMRGGGGVWSAGEG